MPKLVIQSSKFPGISLPVPQMPGDEKQSGSFNFVVGHTYEVSAETAAAIKALFDGFPSPFANEWSLSISESATQAKVVDRPPPPPKPHSKSDPTVPLDEPSPEDDDDLVSVEVAKLEGERLAVSIPRLQNTALNPDFPLEIRIGYLNAVIAHSTLAKGLKNEAASLLKQINPESEPEPEVDSESSDEPEAE